MTEYSGDRCRACGSGLPVAGNTDCEACRARTQRIVLQALRRNPPGSAAWTASLLDWAARLRPHGDAQ